MTRFDEAAANWDDSFRRVRLTHRVGELVLREADPAPDADVLDYGCGTGLLGRALLPHVGGVTGADASTGMLRELRRRIAEEGLDAMRALRLDLTTDPPPADRYDLVVACMALHHIARTDRVLRAFFELLRPGGVACIADLDAEGGAFHSADDASVHHHGFDRDALGRRLESAGFAAVRSVTALEFTKKRPDGGEGEFSIFLMTAERPVAGAG